MANNELNPLTATVSTENPSSLAQDNQAHATPCPAEARSQSLGENSNTKEQVEPQVRGEIKSSEDGDYQYWELEPQEGTHARTKLIKDSQFDKERALYNLQDAIVKSCVFAGPADGESVLKEARNITVENCNFALRYPLWHNHNFIVRNSVLNDLSRAPLWYDHDGVLEGCTINAVKAVRECLNIELKHCILDSEEFGWKSSAITLEDCILNAVYCMLDSRNVTLRRVKMTGKYSFQYMNEVLIEDCDFDTKDAFWHSRNVIVKNSRLKGEYLGWFSDGLTLINCKIIGTQPLCYCKNLKLINCTMEQCDLSFEYSDVEAEIQGHVDSIKNPRSGTIKCDSVGEIIHDHTIMDCHGQVIINS